MTKRAMPPELQERVGHRFERPELLREALVHSSYANECPEPTRDNERLEFLGDAVLELTVATWLFEELREMGEGTMTKTRAQMVQEATLARIAEYLGLGGHLLLGHGEALSGGRAKPSLLGDAVEAVVAAIYLDGGYEAAARCVRAWFTAIEELPGQAVALSRDPRSRLQEIVQARWGDMPIYSIEDRHGPDHASVFRARVDLPGEKSARGEGLSKKEAMRNAALSMLSDLDEV